MVDLNIEILKDIRAELKSVNVRLEDGFASVREEVASVREEVASVREEVASMRADLGTLEHETIRGFTAVRRELDRANHRLDGIRDIAADKWRDHEARIRALEAQRGGGALRDEE